MALCRSNIYISICCRSRRYEEVACSNHPGKGQRKELPPNEQCRPADLRSGCCTELASRFLQLLWPRARHAPCLHTYNNGQRTHAVCVIVHCYCSRVSSLAETSRAARRAARRALPPRTRQDARLIAFKRAHAPFVCKPVIRNIPSRHRNVTSKSLRSNLELDIQTVANRVLVIADRLVSGDRAAPACCSTARGW